MDAVVKAKWIAALNSGKYKQEQNVLRSASDNFCCLGVLCDVVNSSKWKKNEYGRWKYETVSAVLPEELRKSTGINLFQENKLIRLNDIEQCTFEQIAHWIGENL